MNSAYYLQRFLHTLCEWAVSFGVVYWISENWNEQPSSPVVGLVKHPQRFWLALALGIAPAIISLLFWGQFMRLFPLDPASSLRLEISYVLSAIYGALFGLAASCVAAPARSEAPFRFGPAIGIITALAVMPLLLWSFLLFQRTLYITAEILVAAAVLAVARWCLREPVALPAADGTGGSPPPRRNLTLGILAGFLPSVLILATIAVASSTNLGKPESEALLWLASIVSVFCCFGASYVLFSRKTTGAIVGGILLLLLNAFIAFFFGCCASLNFSNMH